MRRAALKAGMTVPLHIPALKSLTQLRKKLRADKTKSGKKAPRKFDIIPLHKELNNEQESEDIQLSLASKHSTTSRSTYDDIIDSVVNQAYVDMDLSIVEVIEEQEDEDEIQPKDAVA